MTAKVKNIGIEVAAPQGECNDPNCPFHGDLSVRGQIIDGVVETVKMNIDVPLIVGGGIRTPEAAAAAREAGADIIVTGTFVEQCSDDTLLKAVVKAAKGI